MKTIFLAFFLLFAFSTTLPSTTADVYVFDTDGEPLKNGDASYHIVPAFSGRGGGLELGITGNETCPLTVVQARFDTDPGRLAALASPINSPFILEGTNLSISFTELPGCVPKPSHWEVVQEFPIGWAVKQANIAGLDRPFKIEKYDNFGPFDYKLVFCRGVDNVCGDLGIHNWRLVVRDGNPFIVNFRKADENSAKWNTV